MYPNFGSGSKQPSAPPPPSSSSSSTLTNSGAPRPIGFSSLMNQPNNQSAPYPGGSSSQSLYPQGPPPPPPPSSSSSSSPYNNPYGANNQAQSTNNYSAYSLPNVGRPTQQSQSGNPYPSSQGNNPGYQNPYQSGSNYGPPPPTSSSSSQGNNPGYQNPYQSGSNYGPPPPSSSSSQGNNPGYQSPYQSGGNYGPPPSSSQGYNSGYQNSYQSGNNYGPPPPPSSQGNNPGYQNPYQSQQSRYPPQDQSRLPYNQQQQQQQQPSVGGFSPYDQQQFYQNPYPSYPQQAPGGYPPYNQQQQGYPPAGGYNNNSYGPPVGAANDRIRSIAGRHEISDALAQRLNILQQFELVILCDDSGSMNTPVDGTNGTRWDELCSIVQIIIEIGTVFDSNGVDVHFLNRPPMRNITDTRQVIESFSQRPGGMTPLTAALRQIFQSNASKPNSDKRLLIFVATDGAPTDSNGTVDIRSLENLMQNERRAQTTYVTFLACTDDEQSVSYLSQWDRTMQNVDVVDDYKSEREEVRRTKGYNFPFSFGDYVAKALLGAVDPQMDSLDESSAGYNNNFRRF